MSLSVIMPNYNHGHFIARALSALVHQTPAAKEIVVVDDGSTDNSVEVIEKFQKRWPIIRLIRHPTNLGPIAAMRTAHDAVSGDYVLSASADDFVLPGLFAHVVSAMEKYPKAALFCGEVVIIDQNDEIIGFRPTTLPRLSGGYISPEEVRRLSRESENWFVGTSVVHRRQRLAEIGHFDYSLGSLTDGMANRLLAFRHGFYFEPSVVAACRMYRDSFSARAALSNDECQRMSQVAGAWIEKNFPADVRSDYRQRFDRRLRFNVARLRLVWGSGRPDADAVSDALGWGGFDRTVARTVTRVPVVSSHLLLAWMWVRMRPYSLTSLAAATWRHVTVNRGRRITLKRQIADMGRASASAVS